MAVPHDRGDGPGLPAPATAGYFGGISTWSITWMTPLPASTSGTAMSVVVPMTPRMFFAMRRGQSFARRVTISGACYRPTLTSAAVATDVRLARSRVLAPFPSAPPPAVRGSDAPDDPARYVSCALDGEVWLIVRRIGGTRTHY